MNLHLRTLPMHAHLLRHMAWSTANFGPAERREGVLDHMTKEIAEVRASGGDSSEWVDLVILSLDGLLRRLETTMRDNHSREEVVDAAVAMLVAKMGRNERRVWPDWRGRPEDKAIEHDRSGE